MYGPETQSAFEKPSDRMPDDRPPQLLEQGYEYAEIAARHPHWIHDIRNAFEANYPQIIADEALWPWQKDAVNSFRALLDVHVVDDDPTIRASLAHSMGLGKTITMATLFKACGVGTIQGGSTIRGAFVAPENHMLTNFVGGQDPTNPRGLARVAPHIKATIWNSPGYDPSADVIAISLNAAIAESKKHLTGEGSAFPFHDISIFGNDEGDAALHGSSREFLEEFSKGRISICSTGTPYQADGSSVFDLWPETIGSIDFRESIETHDITNGRPMRFVTLTPGGKQIQVDGLTPEGEIKPEDMDIILKRENIRQFALELATTYWAAGMQVVMYTHPGDKSSFARQVASDLDGLTLHAGTPEERTLSAAAVGSFSPKKSAALLKRFSEGQIDVLLSSRLGEAGLDAPGLNVVICMAPTGSRRRALQQAGRLAHNQGDGPLLVVFVAYDVVDWHTLNRPAQLTPVQLFDMPRGHGTIRPKRRARGHNSTEGLRYSRILLADDIRDLVREQRQKYPFTMAEEFSLRARGTHARPGEFEVDEVAALSGVDADTLIRILHAERQYVSTRTIDGQPVSFCNEAGLLHLDTVVSTNGEYSSYDIAEQLGLDLEVVRQQLTRRFNDAPYTTKYDRVLRAHALRPQRQYDRQTLEAVGAVIAGRPVPRRSSETPAIEIANETGRSIDTVVRYFQNAEIVGRRRKIAEQQSPAVCYELTPAQRAAAVAALTITVREVPADGSFIPLGQLREGLPKYINLSIDEIAERLPDTFGVEELYSHNRASRYLPREHFERALAHLTTTFARPEGDSATRLGRSADDQRPISIEELETATGYRTNYITSRLHTMGIAVSGETSDSTISYADGVLWLQRMFDSPILADAERKRYAIVRRNMLEGIVPKGELPDHRTLAEIARKANTPFQAFRFVDATGRQRVDDYVLKTDVAAFKKAVAAHYSAQLTEPKAEPKRTLASTIAMLEQEYKVDPHIAAVLGEFVFADATQQSEESEDDAPSAPLPDVSHVIRQAMERLNIVPPDSGRLSRSASRQILTAVVSSETALHQALRQGVRATHERLKITEARKDSTTGQTRAVNDRDLTLYAMQQADLSHWATIDEAAKQLGITPQAFHTAMLQCRPQHRDITRGFTSQGQAVLRVSAGLQNRCRAFLIDQLLRKR